VPSDIHIGKGAVLLGQSAPMRDLEAGKVYLGSPADESRQKFKELALIRRLPELFDKSES
jgi:UDP-3-O-[3-hydroxymyristoyl] glucosamine N-acyltransferase